MLWSGDQPEWRDDGNYDGENAFDDKEILPAME